MTLHRVVALEERFNLRGNIVQLVGCERSYSNVTAMVGCILCGNIICEESKCAFC